MWESLTRRLVGAYDLDSDYQVVDVSSEMDALDSDQLLLDPCYFSGEPLSRSIEDYTKTIRAPAGHCIVTLSALGRPDVITVELGHPHDFRDPSTR